ncbi:hypothetical protein SAMN05216214_109122 [Atopomonas hussainii]|uniref:Transcriptional regulator SutA RNAP-binding domain-containing protein n=1 Tax=Atopomonas hussainii TaxID=1429083 RepID=A0A1H7NFC2_9GAMM|nr:hypothetical protein [Atopomonas hussainii]SEL21999.1 hypothetical protein SAMN05216214_109122 [Atopomonas hussainii]
MSDDDIEQDDTELEDGDDDSLDDDDGVDGADDYEGDDGDDGDGAPRASKKKKKSSDADDEGDHSLAAKNRERDALQAQIEAFLAKGGKVEVVGDDVSADPPKKPAVKYGSRPI